MTGNAQRRIKLTRLRWRSPSSCHRRGTTLELARARNTLPNCKRNSPGRRGERRSTRFAKLPVRESETSLTPWNNHFMPIPGIIPRAIATERDSFAHLHKQYPLRCKRITVYRLLIRLGWRVASSTPIRSIRSATGETSLLRELADLQNRSSLVERARG